MPRLQLSLLGGFQALLDNRPLDGFLSDKVRGLLIYLATEADRPHRRAKLASLFWADLPERRSLTYLRHALANLRKILGDKDLEQPVLLVTPQSLQFNRRCDHQVDVHDLLAVLDAIPNEPSHAQLAALEEVLAGKDRPFLDGFFPKDCPAFEEWMLLTRRRLLLRVLAGLDMLGNAYAQQGEYTRAVDFAQRSVTLAPWREEGHRQLMRLLALSGQRSAALAQYESCRLLLRRELDVEPGAETAELYRAILAGDFDRAVPPVAVLPPVSEPHHNLPVPLTPLVGREEAMRAVQRLFTQEKARLVTLTGPGGVGKTRLALAVARAMLRSFPDGVYFVELAPVREASFVLSALAETVGVGKRDEERPLLEQLAEHFRNQTALLVLDNFEHVLEAAPQIADLLAAAPHLKALATSRVSLQLRGEFVFVVPPLTLPDANSSEEDGASALELFRQRARAANQHFVLDAATRPQAVALCARLDGLPLALELAAAQLRYTSLPALLAGLNVDEPGGSLALLQADLVDAPERQRSLWATIAWSYDLLDAAEQTLFRRLAVFVGSWDEEAAVAVCGEGLALPVDVGIHKLVDAHLVQPAQGGRDEQPRYEMLETIREFGLAQLQRNGELLPVQRRHALYYQTLTERLDAKMQGPERSQTRARLIAEYPNIRRAITWATQQKEPTIALSICGSLMGFWYSWSPVEALPLVEPALAMAEGSPPSVAYVHGLVCAGFFANALGRQQQCRKYFEAAMAMYEAIGRRGNKTKIEAARGLLIAQRQAAGEIDVHTAVEEALRYAYASEDQWTIAIGLANGGQNLAVHGEFEKGRALAEKGLAKFRQMGSPFGISVGLHRLGVIHYLMDDWLQAKAYFLDIIAIYPEAKITSHLCHAKGYLALIAQTEGEYARSLSLIREALIAAQESGLDERIPDTLGFLSQMAAQAGWHVYALTLAGFANEEYARRRITRTPVQKRGLEASSALARQHLSQEEADRAWRQGMGMSLEQALPFAQSCITAMEEQLASRESP